MKKFETERQIFTNKIKYEDICDLGMRGWMIVYVEKFQLSNGTTEYQVWLQREVE